MSFDELLRLAITALVYAGIAALLAAIVCFNVYAIAHSWRSGRIVWCMAIAVLFFTGAGGGIVTAAYLVIHHDEPLPPRQSAYA